MLMILMASLTITVPLCTATKGYEHQTMIHDISAIKNSVNFIVSRDYLSFPLNFQIYTGNGEGTIATLDPLYKSSIGQSQRLSHLDMLQANMMYQCSDKRLSACSLASDPCVNHGFLNRSCICVCPGGTSGDFCETITSTNHGQWFITIRCFFSSSF